MMLKPVQPEEQVIKACQVGLTVISSEDTAIPGNLLDGTASFKNLLIGVIQGNLFICQKEAPPKIAGESPPKEEVKPPQKPVRKKRAKKCAKKTAAPKESG